MARLAEEASSYSAGTRWAPILEGRLAGRAVDAIGAIERSLRTPVLDEPASLACGRAGLAVLYAYLAKAGLLGDADETASAFLDQSVEAVGEVGMSADLYDGFTGVAWAVEHLRAEDGTDPNQDVDLALRDHLGRAPWRNGYDLVSGLVGIGVLGVEQELEIVGAVGRCPGVGETALVGERGPRVLRARLERERQQRPGRAQGRAYP
jgi:hypothetical protein